ncbi:hypothetical protein DES53_11722 [Roseimicrobium gellanilyticum]|uniref:Uncharacterized protein n=2 Tax=Roseimicrobium gellanilyticum TaxID=748857 RepID=A0A366H3C0_9BACT|nr:hypothetical protein DES53_11722 [Roseimicrobium gellanilyticum]
MKAPSGMSAMRTLTVAILAVPVLYVLSFPPIAALAAERLPGPHPDPVYPPAPVWLVRYGQPYFSLMKTSVLQVPLKSYFDWWWLFRFP